MALLATPAAAQLPTTVAPQLFGPKSVLERFKDAQCTIRDSGTGSTQSWTRIPSARNCYQLTAGMLCNMLCVYQLACQYDIRSGVTASLMADSTCSGTPQQVVPFASQLYWLQAESFFRGGCVSDGNNKYLRFSSATAYPAQWPDCSSYGQVEPGAVGGPTSYAASYTMQFYADSSCNQAYQVTASSSRPTSTFTFKQFRGAQYCYDMVDATDRSNLTARNVDYSMLNWRFVCGNVDQVGNGIMIQAYSDPRCSGRATQAQNWEVVFYPMNFPTVQGLLNGRCTRFGAETVKFDRALDAMDYPDCSSAACSQGLCTGGRVQSPTDTSGTLYMGPLRSSGGQAITAPTAMAHAQRAPLVALLGALAATTIGGVGRPL